MENETKNYVVGDDGKYYRFNLKMDNVYFCEDNVIIDNGVIKKYDKSRYEIIDCYIIDKQKKTVTEYFRGKADSFVESIGEGGHFKSLRKETDENGEYSIIVIEPIVEIEGYNGIKIMINKHNQMTFLSNPYATEIGVFFCAKCYALTRVDLSNATEIGLFFCYKCLSLTEVNLPYATKIGGFFCDHCRSLTYVNLPNATKIGHRFCNYCPSLTDVNLQNATEIGDRFCYGSDKIKTLNLQNYKGKNPDVDRIRRSIQQNQEKTK